MGTKMSIMGKLGLPGGQSVSADEIFDHSFDCNICNFEQFHVVFLSFFSEINSIVPGKRYEAPPLEKIWECYQGWKDADENSEEKKHMVMELMLKHVNIIQTTDNSMLLTGLVAPPAAMILKRVVPDVVFVPSFTLLALVAVKMIQINSINKIL